MWSTLEIIQFVCLNFICLSAMSLSLYQSIKYFKIKDQIIINPMIFLLNLTWFILLYTLTFAVSKGTWGVIMGVDYGFIILNILYFIWIAVIRNLLIKPKEVLEEEIAELN